MAEDKFKQAQDFRSRAGQLREIARGLTRRSERRLLMQVADEYDAMARSAATIAKAAVARATGGEKAANTVDRRPTLDGGLK
jgi:hypothetical protein